MDLNSRVSYGTLKVIFTPYIFSRIFKKRELRENMYNAKISTFTVYSYGVTNRGGGGAP